MYSTFFDVHSTYTSIISSSSIPKERRLMCSRADALFVGHTKAIVASLVLPPPSPFSITITFAPASNAVIAATAPAPPHPNTSTSVSSSHSTVSFCLIFLANLSANVLDAALLHPFFTRKSLEETLSFQLIDQALIKKSPYFQIDLWPARLLLNLF